MEPGSSPLRSGNPLAVFPDAGGLTAADMQAIARTLNLSETTFVTSTTGDSYTVRIFTPHDELPFAGHPTIGTSWVLRRLGIVTADEIVQSSSVGRTDVRVQGDQLWFERPGKAARDLEETDPGIDERLAKALGLDVAEIGLEARELGRAGRLRPAFADAGVGHLLVPLRDLRALERCRPSAPLLGEVTTIGVYCFTSMIAGRLRARGFFPAVGIDEDPATGSAAAELGILLADRAGDIDQEVVQGVELKRPSRISVRARSNSVQVGGRCAPIYRARLDQE